MHYNVLLISLGEYILNYSHNIGKSGMDFFITGAHANPIEFYINILVVLSTKLNIAANYFIYFTLISSHLLPYTLLFLRKILVKIMLY